MNNIDNMFTYSKPVSWEFETDVTIDKTEPAVIEVNDSAPNGMTINSVTMTPYEVFVDTGYDESKVMPGYEKYDSLQCVMLDAAGKRIEDKVGFFSPAGYALSKITIYFYPAQTEEIYMETQEKLHDESFKDRLADYLEEIAVHKTEIDLTKQQ